MMRMSVNKGMIRKVSIGKNVNVSPKVATNSLGWEVQAYDEVTGWSKVPRLPIVPQRGVAEMMMEEMTKEAVVESMEFNRQPLYRVYEALQFPIQ